MSSPKNNSNLFQKGNSHTIWSALIFGILMGVSYPVWSGEILDDSLSPQRQYGVQFEWAHQGNAAGLSREAFYLIRSTVSGVEVRLDTAAHKGRRARIFLGLPRQIEGFSSTEGFLLSWETDRIFSPGNVRPGNRTLLFDGVVETPLMVEIFTFTLEVDANYLNGRIRYAPFYEIETY